MSFLQTLLLLGAGFLGGVLTTIAGGASFVLFPTLIFVGLTPLVANTTNFVGLIFAPPMALATSYRSELVSIGRSLLPSLLSGVAGGATGAMLLLWTGESAFARAVPYLMLVATTMFAAGPAIRNFVAPRLHVPLTANSLPCQSLVFLLSIYAGYFGAGVGMMLLGVLAVFGYDDIHKANAVKNAVVGLAATVATAIYGLSGPVAWPHALALMAGSVAGAYAGGIIAKRAPQRLLRLALILLGTSFTIYLFWR